MALAENVAWVFLVYLLVPVVVLFAVWIVNVVRRLLGKGAPTTSPDEES